MFNSHRHTELFTRRATNAPLQPDLRPQRTRIFRGNVAKVNGRRTATDETDRADHDSRPTQSLCLQSFCGDKTPLKRRVAEREHNVDQIIERQCGSALGGTDGSHLGNGQGDGRVDGMVMAHAYRRLVSARYKSKVLLIWPNLPNVPQMKTGRRGIRSSQANCGTSTDGRHDRIVHVKEQLHRANLVSEGIVNRRVEVI